MEKTTKYSIFRTKWGYFGLVGTEFGLLRSCLPGPEPEKIKSHLLRNFSLISRESGIENRVSRIEFDKNYFKTAQEQITAYFEGICVNFSNIPTILHGFSQFNRSVLTACQHIKFGKTVSYSELAKKIGRPDAARAVGNALAKNPLPLIIPCHRVIRSDGKMGGFSTPGGVIRKKAMLELERKALGT